MNQQEILDIVVRSAKTFLAAFIATLTASGVDVTHLTITKQLALAALAAGVTAVLNAGIKVHAAVNQATVSPIVVAPSLPPPSPPVTPLTPDEPTI